MTNKGDDYLAKKYMIPFETILELHKEGLSDNDISKILNCSRSNITIRLNKNGYIGRKSKIDNIELRNRISDTLIGKYTGKNNPNYKGYISEKTIARGIFKTISKKLIRNNNYKCSICNKVGGDLETHHIKPFSIIFEEFINFKYSGDINNFYNEIIEYDDFTNEENLVVICKKCHNEIHYKDNPDLSPYRWERATTIES